MTVTYTPGPWTYVEDEDDGGFEVTLGETKTSYRWYAEQKFSYAEDLYPEDGAQYQEAEANVRLMVAAPDLLGALENLLALDDITEALSAEDLVRAREAVARAYGPPHQEVT